MQNCKTANLHSTYYIHNLPIIRLTKLYLIHFIYLQRAHIMSRYPGYESESPPEIPSMKAVMRTPAPTMGAFEQGQQESNSKDSDTKDSGSEDSGSEDSDLKSQPSTTHASAIDHARVKHAEWNQFLNNLYARPNELPRNGPSTAPNSTRNSRDLIFHTDPADDVFSKPRPPTTAKPSEPAAASKNSPWDSDSPPLQAPTVMVDILLRDRMGNNYSCMGQSSSVDVKPLKKKSSRGGLKKRPASLKLKLPVRARNFPDSSSC